MPNPLVRDVFYQVSVLLQDLTPQFRRWTERELVAWANEAQRAIAKFVPIAGGRVLVMRLTPGVRQSLARIPAASILPAAGPDVHGLFLNDIVCNMGADGLVPGASVSVISREALDGVARGWRTERPTTAIEHFMFDPRTPQAFEVYPPVAAGGTWVEVGLIASPEEIPPAPAAGDYGADAASTQTLGIDARWGDDLVNYILARAWMKDAKDAGNAQLVQMYAGLFVNSINAQVAALIGHNPNLKVLPLMPDVPAAAS